MAETKHDTIAAVVVTYSRKELLVCCLEALCRQSHLLDAIYIIDNCSVDGTYEYLLERDWIAPVPSFNGQIRESRKAISLLGQKDQHIEIRYVAMSENTGGAGGFHEGLGRAVEAGFDWLWLMDDDLEVSPGALKALVEKRQALAAAHHRPFLLNSLVLSKEHPDGDTLAFPLQELSIHGLPKAVKYWRLSEIKDKASGGLYQWACPFNGTFISTEAVSEIGLPNKDLYIKGDEKDYLWRAARQLDLYTVLDSKVYHPGPFPMAFDWKSYYLIRNMFVVNRHFRFTRLRNLRLIVVGLAMGLRHGRAGTSLVIQAIKDGLSGRLGRRDDIRTWLNAS